MKRSLALTLLAAALLVPATAQAAFLSGTYSGKTANKGPVSFKATQSKLSLFKIGVVFSCTDGDKFQTTIQGFPAQNIVKVRGVGKYNATFTGSTGASRYVHKGSILNRRATGTFTGRRTYNEQDELDPQGTVVCTTGTLRYSILRVVRRT